MELKDVGLLEEIDIANSKQCKKALGDIMNRLPKKVLEMTKCQETGEILYLCSWYQDEPVADPEIHYLPSWVRSYILASVLQNYDLIKEFYESHLPRAQQRAQLNKAAEKK